MLRKTYKNEIYSFSYAGKDLIHGMENASWYLAIDYSSAADTLINGLGYMLKKDSRWMGCPNIIIQVINDIISVNISNIHMMFNKDNPYMYKQLPISYLYNDDVIHINIHADALLRKLIEATNAYCDPHIIDALNRFPFDYISVISGDAYVSVWDNRPENIDYPTLHLTKCLMDMNKDNVYNIMFIQEDTFGRYISALQQTIDTYLVEWIQININFKLQLKKKFKVFILNNIKHLQNYYIN